MNNENGNNREAVRNMMKTLEIPDAEVAAFIKSGIGSVSSEVPADEIAGCAAYLDFLMDQLSDRECAVIEELYGLGNGSTHTTEEVGRMFGVPGDIIKQIELTAMRKLKNPVNRGLHS